jgi:hypothetical protein
LSSVLPVPAQPLKKPVFALGLRPKGFKLTLMGRKLWNVLVYKAQQDRGLSKDVFRAPLREIIAGVDFNSNDHALVKYHLRTLLTTLVEWESPTSGESAEWEACTLISHTRIWKERGVTWLEWSLPPNMREKLLDPDVYAQIHLKVAAQMSSYSGLALYEICARYRDVRTARNSWQWWVPVLTGRPDDERLQKMECRHFKRDVLRPAIAEVNVLAEFEVTLVEHKQGRFISDIQFTIQKKAQLSLEIGESTQPIDMSVLADGEKLGIEQSKLEHLIVTYGEEAVKLGLIATARRMASAFPEPLRDVFRYLKTMMPGHAATVVQKQGEKIEAQQPAVTAAASGTREQA